MRPLYEIRQEAEKECIDNQCTSWPVICLIAMEKALKEFKNELVEDLENRFLA